MLNGHVVGPELRSLSLAVGGPVLNPGVFAQHILVPGEPRLQKSVMTKAPNRQITELNANKVAAVFST